MKMQKIISSASLLAVMISPFLLLDNGVARTVKGENLDPIVTGRSITEDHLMRWREARARFEECGMCGSEQPFPGDLDETLPSGALITGTIKPMTAPQKLK